MDRVTAGHVAAEEARLAADRAAARGPETGRCRRGEAVRPAGETTYDQAHDNALTAYGREAADVAQSGQPLDAPPPNSEAAQIAVDTACAQLGDPLPLGGCRSRLLRLLGADPVGR